MPVQVGEGVAGGCEVGRGGSARAGKLQVARRAAASRNAVPAPAARPAPDCNFLEKLLAGLYF
jgi:hypothetical protein